MHICTKMDGQPQNIMHPPHLQNGWTHKREETAAKHTDRIGLPHSWASHKSTPFQLLWSKRRWCAGGINCTICKYLHCAQMLRQSRPEKITDFYRPDALPDAQLTHSHNHLMALCPWLPKWAGTRKVKPIWVLLKQETVSGSGISWAICKSASRHAMPVPHHSIFWGPDALPAAQPTASKHWQQWRANGMIPVNIFLPLRPPVRQPLR